MKRTVGAVVGLIATVLGVLAGQQAVRAFVRWREHRHVLVATGDIGVPTAQRDRVAVAMDEEMRPLQEHPRFRAAVENATRNSAHGHESDDARRYGEQLVHDGLARLPLPELEDMARLRLALAARSPAVCAGLWTGAVDGHAIGAAIAALPDVDLHRLLHVEAHAGILALEASGPVQPDAPALGDGIAQIAKLVPPADQEAFQNTVAAGASAPSAGGCLVVRALLAHEGELAPDLRERFLRAYFAN